MLDILDYETKEISRQRKRKALISMLGDLCFVFLICNTLVYQDAAQMSLHFLNLNRNVFANSAECIPRTDSFYRKSSVTWVCITCNFVYMF